MSELPLGWVETELGDIFQVQSGFAFKSNEYTDRGHFLVRIANVQDGYLTLDKPKYVELPEALRRFELREGDILTSLTGNIGRVAEVEACHLPAALNQRVARLSLSGQEPHKPYLIWFLRTSAFSGFLEEKSHGAAQLNVSPSAVAEVPLPLPPLTEQKRIVAKLDALATKSARARTDLARIDTLVTRYKQAVLSKAFDLSPNSSCIEFREYIQAANNGLSKRSGDQGELINVLRLADLDEAVFSPGEPRKIRMSEKELEKYRLHSMDLVVIRVNGSSNLVGRAFAYDAEETWAFCDHFIRIKLNEGFDAKYTSMYLNSPAVRSLIEQKFVSTSGQKTISQKTLETLPAPNVSFSEQREIVRRTERAFQKIDRLAVEAKRALELVGKLDEAILAKAFKGQLVPQDPNDEPASVLLKRIKAERAAAPKGKRGRGKR